MRSSTIQGALPRTWRIFVAVMESAIQSPGHPGPRRRCRFIDLGQGSAVYAGIGFRCCPGLSLLSWQLSSLTPIRKQIVDHEPLALQLRTKRSEMMASELEEVALRLFDQNGFANVTVEEIASEAHISVRTFYRYFGSKEDVLQLRILRRSEALREELTARPADEPALRSLRMVLEKEFSAVEPIVLRRWIGVLASNPNAMNGVVGAIQLKVQPVIAEFFGSRFGLPSDALVPTMLAAAALGVVQAAHIQWFFHDGDLATTMSESLAVLESAISTDPNNWVAAGNTKTPERTLGRPKSV